jgi:hypothetical protein
MRVNCLFVSNQSNYVNFFRIFFWHHKNLALFSRMSLDQNWWEFLGQCFASAYVLLLASRKGVAYRNEVNFLIRHNESFKF